MNTTSIERARDCVYVTDYNYTARIRQQRRETAMAENFKLLYLKHD